MTSGAQMSSTTMCVVPISAASFPARARAMASRAGVGRGPSAVHEPAGASRCGDANRSFRGRRRRDGANATEALGLAAGGAPRPMSATNARTTTAARRKPIRTFGCRPSAVTAAPGLPRRGGRGSPRVRGRARPGRSHRRRGRRGARGAAPRSPAGASVTAATRRPRSQRVVSANGTAAAFGSTATTTVPREAHRSASGHASHRGARGVHVPEARSMTASSQRPGRPRETSSSAAVWSSGEDDGTPSTLETTRRTFTSSGATGTPKAAAATARAV